MATNQSDRYLEDLVAGLAISDTRYEQAETSYKSFGGWLHRDASTIKAYGPQVYVQGSFALGTVIKPTSEQEDYDVDSICEFTRLDTCSLSQKDLKRRLGVEVKAYHDAQAMTKPVREGRRCWVLDYADGAQFHMDIVPSVPDAQRQMQLLKAAGRPADWSATAISITDNERWNYEVLDQDWCQSNPKGYVRWFRGRMATEFDLRRRALAKAVHAAVEDIPEYRVRTPLQSAVMLLKRHRDIRFGVSADKPISIILTTLAGHAYQSENDVGAALRSILGRMASFIETQNGLFIIRNPTNPLENFADKWAAHPERAKAFFDWLKKAQEDFQGLAGLGDFDRMAKAAGPAVGSQLAERALTRAKNAGGLLRGATAAASGLAFPNTPRVPTTPKGFA